MPNPLFHYIFFLTKIISELYRLYNVAHYIILGAAFSDAELRKMNKTS